MENEIIKIMEKIMDNKNARVELATQENNYAKMKKEKNTKFREILESKIELARVRLKGRDAPKIELRKKRYNFYVQATNDSYESFCDMFNLLYQPLNSKDFEED